MRAKPSDRPAILYQERRPHPDLAKFVVCYWKFEYDPPSSGDSGRGVLHHSVIPDGCVSLFFQKVQSDGGGRMAIGFLGPRTTVFKTEMPPGHLIVGVRFLPGVIGSLFGVSGAELRDKVVEALLYVNGLGFEKVLPKLEPGFDSFRLFDAPLLRVVRNSDEVPDSDTIRAVDAILKNRGKLEVGKLARSLSVGPRQLQRKFRTNVGLTAKEFARVCRMRASVIDFLMNNRSLQDLVHDGGYFDQAHFIRDYSLMSSTNPTTLLRYLSGINHKDMG